MAPSLAIRGSLGIGAVRAGSAAVWTRTFGPEEVQAFADVSGDHNPVHVDPEFAAQTRFRRCIAHGILTGSMFGTMLATQLPGSIYVSQAFDFRAPVFVGDTVTATVTVTDVTKGRRVQCSTVLTNDSTGKVAIDGMASLLATREAMGLVGE